MHTIKVNNYVNTFSPAVIGSISIQDWLDQIKSPSDYHKEQILSARPYKSLYVATGNKVIKKEYDNIKLPLPSVTYNALFNGTKEDKNYLAGTGLLYIDIDKIGFDPESLDKELIFSYYRSIGGLGYSILVRVNNLNINNFHTTYSHIVDQLGLTSMYDTDAKKLTQQSILSFDPDIYINNNSFVFTALNIDLANNNLVPNPLISNKKEEHNRLVGYKEDLELRVKENNVVYNNLNAFNFNGKDSIENWNERFDYVQCFKPFKQLKDGRKRIMMNYVRNLVWLNSTIEYYRLLNSCKFVNKQICEVPLPDKKIEEMVNLVLKQSREAKLTPKITKKIILFNPTKNLGKSSKLQLWGQATKAKFSEIGTGRLYEIIEDWNFEFNGKITIRSVAENSDMNKKTVAKYWSTFIDYIGKLNDLHTLEISLFKEAKRNIAKDTTEIDLVQLMTDMDVITMKEQSTYHEYVHFP